MRQLLDWLVVLAIVGVLILAARLEWRQYAGRERPPAPVAGSR